MSRVKIRLLGIVCLCLVIGLLVFGLWPFHHPKNQVRWITGGDGLRLGRRATIVSDGPLKITGADPHRACSVEIWLQPDRENDSGTIAAFYDSSTGGMFSIRQELTDLVLQTERRGQLGKRANINRVFRSDTPVFLTIASSDQGTAVYMDGRLSSKCFGSFDSRATISRTYLSLVTLPFSLTAGRGLFSVSLSIANMCPVARRAGIMSADENWYETPNGQSDDDDGLVAIYPFSEHSGDVARSAHSTAVELRIPERYSILDKTLLEAPWKAFRPTWDYWNDVAVNIVGFVPLGCLRQHILGDCAERPARPGSNGSGPSRSERPSV